MPDLNPNFTLAQQEFSRLMSRVPHGKHFTELYEHATRTGQSLFRARMSLNDRKYGSDKSSLRALALEYFSKKFQSPWDAALNIAVFYQTIDTFKTTLLYVRNNVDRFKELIHGDERVPQSLKSDDFIEFVHSYLTFEKVTGEWLSENSIKEIIRYFLLKAQSEYENTTSYEQDLKENIGKIYGVEGSQLSFTHFTAHAWYTLKEVMAVIRENPSINTLCIYEDYAQPPEGHSNTLDPKLLEALPSSIKNLEFKLHIQYTELEKLRHISPYVDTVTIDYCFTLNGKQIGIIKNSLPATVLTLRNGFYDKTYYTTPARTLNPSYLSVFNSGAKSNDRSDNDSIVIGMKRLLLHYLGNLDDTGEKLVNELPTTTWWRIKGREHRAEVEAIIRKIDNKEITSPSQLLSELRKINPQNPRGGLQMRINFLAGYLKEHPPTPELQQNSTNPDQQVGCDADLSDGDNSPESKF